MQQVRIRGTIGCTTNSGCCRLRGFGFGPACVTYLWHILCECEALMMMLLHPLLLRVCLTCIPRR